MATTLRDLLIQRAARLQERPALTATDWGTLSYAQLRNRAEGVALGLLAEGVPASAFSASGTPWDWVAELAAASSGLTWGPGGDAVPPEVLGGPRFNHEGGRGTYHAREQVVEVATPFVPGMSHGELMARLRRLNVKLGWDHDTRVELPLAHLGDPWVRAALWSALYAGAEAALVSASLPRAGTLLLPGKGRPSWDDAPFERFWEP